MPQSENVRDEAELRRLTESAALERAFQLAHSIYCFREKDRRVALEIVWEALRGVEVRLVAQREADRHVPQKPTKVRWSTLQWFQILIYYKSETYERRQETSGGDSLTQKDMVIRYIKHLILTTSRLNSFHITLGVTRLLYDYSTVEAMVIYDLIFQDPDASTKKADAYYRGRKNKLIEVLGNRFGGMLRIKQGPRGGKRFQPQNDSAQFADLVVRCLTRFTPWEVSCVLPTPLDTWASVHPLRDSQASQIHSLIHPDCFSRIVEALKLDPPEKRLALPMFSLPGNRDDETGSTDDGSTPSSLTEDEADSIRKRVEEERLRRRKFTPQTLRILTDGKEAARIALAQSSRVRLDIPDDVTLIEVFGVHEDAELLLATHVLTQEEDELLAGRANEYSLALEGGQKISLLVSPVQHSAGDERSISIEVIYQEAGAATASALWRRFGRWLAQTTALKNWRNTPLLNPKWAIAIAALALVGLLLYFGLSGRRRAPEEIAQRQPPPSSLGTPTPASAPSPPTNATPERTPSNPKPKAPGTNKPSQPGITRGPSERAVKSLEGIKRLYVRLTGDDAFARAVRQRLKEKLQTLNRFVITESRDDADTALVGVARSGGGHRDEVTGEDVESGSVTVELVNVYGEVIWRKRRLTGTADQVASRFTNDLLDAIEAERLHRKP
jgi:hypothetical protein